MKISFYFFLIVFGLKLPNCIKKLNACCSYIVLENNI